MARRKSRSAALSYRTQIFATLIFAVILPTLVRLQFDFVELGSPFNVRMMLWTAVAAVVGLSLYRRVLSVPGASPGYLVLPAYAASYLGVILILFFFRMEYSRTVLAASFAASVLLTYLSFVIFRPNKSLHFAVVPGGRVARLKKIATITYEYLDDPDAPLPDCDGVVVDLRIDLSEKWARFIADATLAGVPVFHVKEIEESLTGQVEIEHLSENNLGSLNPNEAYLDLKNTLDWLTAVFAVIVLMPVFVVVAIAIKLDSPGPVFFRQERRGYRHKVFRIYKFRTMTELPHTDPGEGGEAGAHTEISRAITQPGDRRITRVGRLLRRTRLDELPQIFNIVKGEMSWIGPRPEAVVLSRWYESELPFYSYRHIVRPGITGWAQVKQGHVAEVDDVLKKLHYDFYYIKNFSFWLDTTILFLTIAVVLSGTGSK